MTKSGSGNILEPKPLPDFSSDPDARLLAAFLHELNIARHSLTLYPPGHPQLASSSGKVLKQLEKLFGSRDCITFGVAPEALLFEHRWLDRENPTFKTFAGILSNFGIASLSFRQGLSAEELVRFCQLLRSDRQTIEKHGGFLQLLRQQQVDHIDIVPIDYGAFQSSTEHDPRSATASELWEDFLHGLLDDMLDAGDGGLRLDPKTIAAILNERLSADDTPAELPTGAVSNFVGRLLDDNQSLPREACGQNLGKLLSHLSPQLQETFMAGTFQTLDKNLVAAGNILEQLPAELLQKALDPQTQQKLKISTRLVELVGQLAANPPDMQHSIRTDSAPLGKDLVRARLDVLFSEENHDLYLPGNYQVTLKNIFNDDIRCSMPEEDKQQLKENFEEQSVELQCCAVIFELLAASPGLEDETAIQQNLLELSRFFLDTGNFSALREIYHHWSAYLYSGVSNAGILDERVLANHTQQAFMLEVVDGLEIWGEESAEPIRQYIATVGEAYTELVIEQLGLARQFSRRRYWMEVLEGIGTDANQLLVQALSDERWYLIRNLLIVLGKNLEPATLKAIHRLADHPHPKVRQEVMRILFLCNPATANRMLLKELNHEDQEARLSAIQIADLSTDSEVLNGLHQQLLSELNSDFDLECKRQILATLALIGHRDSLSRLRRLLLKKALLQSRRQKQFQREIIQSLGKYPRTAAEKLLRELADGRQRQQAKLAEEVLRQLSGESA